MKTKRQNAILSIIRTQYIKTQEELSDALGEQGFIVTQATISRDIKDLCLLKKQMGDGSARYVAGTDDMPTGANTARVRAIFHSSVQSVACAMHTIVIKTLSGMAQPAAITLESMDWPEVLGTIGGDDTVLVVLRDAESAQLVTKRLQNLIDL